MTYNEKKSLYDSIMKELSKVVKRQINESNPRTQDKSFEKWKKTFDEYLYDMIDGMQRQYLDKLHLTIEIDPDYVFSGGKSRWLASYARRSQRIREGVISVGINYKVLYSEMKKRRIDTDRFNIEAQARITIGHEIGHGLVDYIKMQEFDKTSLEGMPNVADVKSCGRKDEEDIVEEFGEYQFPEATDCYWSVLDDALSELTWETNK